MADSRISPAAAGGHQTFKEAVCIDVNRVYDSCSDKDCLEDLRVYFNDEDQEVINNAAIVKSRNAEIIKTILDVEPVQFNRGFYSVDITFIFKITLEAYEAPCARPRYVCGIAVFDKKVILFGSEGNVKVFSSDFVYKADDEQNQPVNNLPTAVVEAVDPVFLNAKLVEPDCPPDGPVFPGNFSNTLEGSCGSVVPLKIVLVTLGLFSIVKIERKVQMLIPAYDFCIPDKECTSSTGDPCDLFKTLKFPYSEFFPPKFKESAEKGDRRDECGDRR